MKRSYNIAIVLAASCLFASLRMIIMMSLIPVSKALYSMRKTSEVVPMPVQGTSSIQIRMYERDRYYSTGDDVLAASGYHVSQDRWDLRELVDVQ